MAKRTGGGQSFLQCWRCPLRSWTIQATRHICELNHFSRVRLSATLRTVALQAPLFMGFSRQEYWNGLPFSSPGDLPNSGIELGSPALQADGVLLVKNPPINAGSLRDAGSISGLRRSPGGGHGNPLQYSCLENPVDRGAWRATVHGVTKSQTRLSSQRTTVLYFSPLSPDCLRGRLWTYPPLHTQHQDSAVRPC